MLLSPLHRRSSSFRFLPALVAAWGAASLAGAAAPTPAPTPDPDGQNVALINLGATAKGSGSAFNVDWPPNGTLQPGQGRGGTLVSPLKGARVDIHLIQPVDIKALEVIGLDYHGTLQAKAIDIFLDGKMVQHVDLPENPGKPTRIPLEAHAQNIGILVTDEYGVRTLPDGTQGPKYGGWDRLRIISPTDLATLMKPVDNFNVPIAAVNISPTAGSEATGTPEVDGQPRMTQGHPCTLWDKQDIAHYKEMLGSSPDLQKQVAGLKNSLEARMKEPTGVPQPRKGANGEYVHISDAETFQGRTYGAIHNQLGLDIANFGTMYQLTGDERYADYAKKILLDYADAFPNYVVGARPGFSHAPSKVFDQVLGDATWLIPVARGYDLIHDMPAMTPDERKHIEGDFLKPDALVCATHTNLEAATNWGAIGTCAVLTAGYALDDAELVNLATNGAHGTPEKPTGGYRVQFSEKAIPADGLWVEGAFGYQFMALEALTMDAEMLWHHGIDMYRYRDCALKRVFDSPLASTYPDLTTPALHDSGHGSLIGTDAFLYEYAFRRYHDPAYLPVLNQLGTHIDAHFQQFPVSVLYDRDRSQKYVPAAPKNTNFFSVGYGYLRNTTEAGTNNLILEYGPAGSHGHPDKLTLDLYALNQQLIMDPGSIWYEIPLYRRWYRTTMAHPTMVVDELDQIMCSAHQTIYGPGTGFGMERAFTQDAYPGVTMDRALFMTPKYVADIFGAFARLPRKLDLAWHIRGQYSSTLPLEAMTFPAPVENGYNELTDVQHDETEKSWSANFQLADKTARFVAAGGTPTDVIVADGHYGLETPKTILERRLANATVYGNAVDISGGKDAYVKSVTQSGGLDDGYALLKVQTPAGTDLCFAAYRPGNYKAGDLATDGLQAFVLKDGSNVSAMYLSGGTKLVDGAATLTRSEAGLASIEKAGNGSYVLANPSPTGATVSVTLPALKGTEAFALDANGKRTGAAPVERKSGAISIALQPLAKVEFAMKGASSVFDYNQGILTSRQAAEEATLAKAKAAYEARRAAREAEAKAKPVPAGTIVVVSGPDFSAHGGGDFAISTNKRAAVGKTISQWNAEGQWAEWTFDVPADGYYDLTLCYCSELDQAERRVQVNGEVQEPFAPMIFPSTGGFSNGSDDWRLFTASNPGTEQPLYLKLKQGKNVIRLTNGNGRPLNVNYLAVTSPDVKVTREMLAAKVPPQ